MAGEFPTIDYNLINRIMDASERLIHAHSEGRIGKDSIQTTASIHDLGEAADLVVINTDVDDPLVKSYKTICFTSDTPFLNGCFTTVTEEPLKEGTGGFLIGCESPKQGRVPVSDTIDGGPNDIVQRDILERPDQSRPTRDVVTVEDSELRHDITPDQAAQDTGQIDTQLPEECIAEDDQLINLPISFRNPEIVSAPGTSCQAVSPLSIETAIAGICNFDSSTGLPVEDLLLAVHTLGIRVGNSEEECRLQIADEGDDIRRFNIIECSALFAHYESAQLQIEESIFGGETSLLLTIKALWNSDQCQATYRQTIEIEGE